MLQTSQASKLVREPRPLVQGLSLGGSTLKPKPPKRGLLPTYKPYSLEAEYPEGFGFRV